MNETLSLALALVAGVLLGAVFFGGLWLTIQRGIASRRPGLWFLGSLLLRTGITLTGFYLAGHGHWQGLAACCVGFLAARLVVTWLTRPIQTRPAPEARYAP